MNVSAPFIRRPIATSLLGFAVLLGGILGYSWLSVSALPQVDFPTIQVTTQLPGANPDTVASLITAPLERQFGQIPALATTVHAAGLPVELELDFDQDGIPAAVQLSVYRIIQEALTNTLKHARATHAHVRIRRQADALTVEILDDGNPISGGTGTGHGLVGMRERVEHFGGELNTGPRPEGGFAVRATLPVPR